VWSKAVKLQRDVTVDVAITSRVPWVQKVSEQLALQSTPPVRVTSEDRQWRARPQLPRPTDRRPCLSDKWRHVEYDGQRAPMSSRRVRVTCWHDILRTYETIIRISSTNTTISSSNSNSSGSENNTQCGDCLTSTNYTRPGKSHRLRTPSMLSLSS